MFASVALIGTAASGVLFGSVFLVPAAVAVGVMRPGGWGVRGGDPGSVEEAEGFQAVVGPAQHVHVQDAGAATQAGQGVVEGVDVVALAVTRGGAGAAGHRAEDRKSTRLNSSHVAISYAV